MGSVLSPLAVWSPGSEQKGSIVSMSLGDSKPRDLNNIIIVLRSMFSTSLLSLVVPTATLVATLPRLQCTVKKGQAISTIQTIQLKKHTTTYVTEIKYSCFLRDILKVYRLPLLEISFQWYEFACWCLHYLCTLMIKISSWSTKW